MNSAGRTAAAPISTIIRPSRTSCAVIVLPKPDVDEVSGIGRGTSERALLPQSVEEALDHALYFQPGCQVIGFENRERGGPPRGFLDHGKQTANRHIPPLVVVSSQGSSAPDQGAFAGERTNRIDRLPARSIDVESLLLVIRDFHHRADHRRNAHIGRGLPNTAIAVHTGIDAGHCRARRQSHGYVWPRRP